MTQQQFRILHPARCPKGTIRAAVFDFDGTFSTLRCGWEKVMRPLMLEMITGKSAAEAGEDLCRMVDDYIDSSTGIQTIYQMQWLKEQADKAGRGKPEHDAWWYKAEYNRRLMQQVQGRLEALERGEAKPEEYLVAGSVTFLHALKDRGIELYLASGTDHRDVLREAGALGVRGDFTEIKGAPEHIAACSKEAVIRMILEEKGLRGEELLLVGDGKVEIALGAACGAYTLGAATDEEHRKGFNETKAKRLIAAGADALTGDFTQLDLLMGWVNGGTV